MTVAPDTRLREAIALLEGDGPATPQHLLQVEIEFFEADDRRAGDVAAARLLLGQGQRMTALTLLRGLLGEGKAPAEADASRNPSAVPSPETRARPELEAPEPEAPDTGTSGTGARR
jgi:hypothetical protein